VNSGLNLRLVIIMAPKRKSDDMKNQLQMIKTCQQQLVINMKIYKYYRPKHSSVHRKPWISMLGYPRYRNYPWIIRYG